MGDRRSEQKRDSFRPFDKDISLIVKCLLKGNPLPKKRDQNGPSDRDSIDSGVGSIPDEEACKLHSTGRCKRHANGTYTDGCISGSCDQLSS